IRQRRLEFSKNMEYIYDILKKGSEKAESIAAQTLDEVKSAMGINYFK
ncbi:MAG: tryptophan--tRNA ligase, partial [Lactovum sp.]